MTDTLGDDVTYQAVSGPVAIKAINAGDSNRVTYNTQIRAANKQISPVVTVLILGTASSADNQRLAVDTASNVACTMNMTLNTASDYMALDHMSFWIS